MNFPKYIYENTQRLQVITWTSKTLALKVKRVTHGLVFMFSICFPSFKSLSNACDSKLVCMFMCSLICMYLVKMWNWMDYTSISSWWETSALCLRYIQLFYWNESLAFPPHYHSAHYAPFATSRSLCISSTFPQWGDRPVHSLSIVVAWNRFLLILKDRMRRNQT